MRLSELLNWGKQVLAKSGVSSAALDAEILLSEVLGLSRTKLYSQDQEQITAENQKTFEDHVASRAEFKPVAYIIGKKEFWGRDFSVGSGTLIPRPETEHIIEVVLKNKSDEVLICDLGSGSGCVGITLALEIPKATIVLVEKSQSAIPNLQKNIFKHSVYDRTTLLNGDVLHVQSKFEKPAFDIVVSNPPYISRAACESLMPDVRDFEPGEALAGGEQGHEIPVQWLNVAVEILKPGGLLVFEMGHDQGRILSCHLSKRGDCESIEVLKDLAGYDRIISARKKNG